VIKGFDSERLFRTIRLGPNVVPGPRLWCAWVAFRDFVRYSFAGSSAGPIKVGDVFGLWRVVEDVEAASSLRRRFTLLPDDPVKVAIDILMLILVLVTVIQVPLVIAFEIADTTTTTMFDTIVDACFAFDIVRWKCFWCFRSPVFLQRVVLGPQVTNFRMAVEDCDRNMHTLPSTMANAYLNGGFRLDFLSTFPFDRVFVATVGMGVSLRSLKLLRFLRLFRLLKLFRFLKLRRYLQRIQRAMVSSPHFLQLIKLVVQVAVVSHVIGCSYYWLSSMDTSASAKHWFTANPTIGSSNSDYYVASVYWAMTTVRLRHDPTLHRAVFCGVTFAQGALASSVCLCSQMSTVGYGDVVPVTPTEVMFVVFAMVLGAVVYGVVASIVGVAVGEMGAPALRISGKMQEVVDYLHVRKVPADLFQRTCAQYEYFLSRKSAFEEEVILSELTESLRREVSTQSWCRTVVWIEPVREDWGLFGVLEPYPGFHASSLHSFLGPLYVFAAISSCLGRVPFER
jgi:Ion transport protein